MKIGDEVCVHGYIDEIRSDVIIIRNDGGYFGTVENEVYMVTHNIEDMMSTAEQTERRRGYMRNCTKCGTENHSEADNPQTDCSWK